MIKLFVTDLDGTLLKNHLYVEEENQEALQSLHRQGIDIAFASGRTDQDIAQLFDELKISGHRLSQNGAFLIDKNKQLLSENNFSHELSKEIYQVSKDLPVYYFVTTKDHTYFDQEIPIIDQLQPLFNHRLVLNQELANDINDGLQVSKVMLMAETEVLHVLKAELDNEFKQQINTFLSAPMCLDISPPGINKATGLQVLCDSLQINPHEIAVIGDSQNDIDMLKMTPHSYVMSSAEHDVKQVANHVVDYVYQAIDHLRTNNLL